MENINLQMIMEDRRTNDTTLYPWCIVLKHHLFIYLQNIYIYIYNRYYNKSMKILLLLYVDTCIY